MTSDILAYMYIYSVLWDKSTTQIMAALKKNPQLCISQRPMFHCIVYFWMGTHCMKYDSKWSREKKPYEMFLILAKENCRKI